MSEQPQYSYSALSTFKSCPLRYKLRYIDGLELRDATSNVHHLAWGSSFHQGLEHYYKMRQSAQINEEWWNDPHCVGRTVEQMQQIFLSAYPYQLDLLDKAKTIENGMRALALYVQRWREEDKKWRIIEVEGPGQVELLDSGLNELHADLIVENLEHGGIYVVDHKTTSKALGSWYWDQFNPNSQITYYIDYCQEKYGSCEGFIINVTSLQWRDKKKKDGANNVAWFDPNDPTMPWLTYSHHEERDYRGGPLGKKGPRIVAWGLTVQFERQTFNRSSEQILQERLSTRAWKEQIEGAGRCLTCGDIEEDHLDMSHVYEYYWPFNTSSCYSCSYRGGEIIPGICRPGYTWPEHKELILLSYRQVCRQIVPLTCPHCGGNGVSANYRAAALKMFTQDELWQTMKPGEHKFSFTPCDWCSGEGTISGPRCQLDRYHEGVCSVELPTTSGEEEIEVLV